MIILVNEHGTNNEFWLNTNYITEMDKMVDHEGANFLRVYMANGRVSFQDISCDGNVIAYAENKDLLEIRKELSRINDNLNQLNREIKRK